MAKVNEHFLQLPQSYLFADIAKRVATFEKAHPGASVIRLGIGDVTRPLPPAVIEALHAATEEMGKAETFHGYGPERGYAFLRGTIAKHDFADRGVEISPDEIFVNDGAKSDTGNFGDILGLDNTLCLTDPIYPVYVDSNAMCGRAGNYAGGHWNHIHYAPCNEGNGFVPELPDCHVDLIYLCYPNNPTGTTLTRGQLKKWVDYALEHDSLILYDAAYEAYISEPDVPHSIYEIEGARHCAVEFHSYSKTAGFTGLRCGYTVIPDEVTVTTEDGRRVALAPLWERRQSTKFNGTAYIVQRAAEAIYTPDGQRQIHDSINYYMENARIMREALSRSGIRVYGGINAPYLWLRVPENTTSWGFFDALLHDYHIVSTPGVGFGPAGEGYIRLTAFGQREDCEEAMKRILK